MNNDNFGVFLSRHYRGIMISVAGVIAVCILVVIILLVSNVARPKTFLQINVAPGNALIEVNGQEYHNGIYEIAPGTYSAEISAEGFESKTQSVTVQKGETAKISTYLLNEDDGMNYYLSSAGDIEILRGIEDQEAKDFLARYDQMVSIREKFPIDASYNVPEEGLNYSQTVSDGSSRPECEMAFCLLVTGYGQPNDEVVDDALSDAGYDMEDYQVVYDFKSEDTRDNQYGETNVTQGNGDAYSGARDNYVFTHYSLINDFVEDNDTSTILLDVINEVLEDHLGGDASQGFSSFVAGKDVDQRVWFPYDMLSFIVQVSNGDNFNVQIALQNWTYLGMTINQLGSQEPARFYIDYMRPANEANYDSTKVVSDLTRWAEKVNTGIAVYQPTIYVSY